MKRKNNPHPFFQFIMLIKGGSIFVFFGTILLLIYLPYQDSISKSFKSSSEFSHKKPFTSKKTMNLDPNRVINGIHVETGMIYDKNFSIVRGACTTCHSSKLIIQNRASRDGWAQMIDWMQDTQGLQDLGEYEVKILDYLEKNYAPTEVGRRKNLDINNIEWYVLND